MTETEQTTKTTFPNAFGTKDTTFLQDPNVQRWHNGLARSSKVTAGVRLRRLRLLCEELNISATELAPKEPSVTTDILDDWLTSTQERPKPLAGG